jgi:glycosyltransferase involved in cell wall biosynthesis
VTPRPSFEKPSTGTEPTQRLLLLSAHFPPATAVGALRWLKMSALLAQEGWGIDVIAARLPTDPSPGAAVVEELPPGIRIWRVSSPEAFFRFPERMGGKIVRSVKTLGSRRPSVRPAQPSEGRKGVDRSNVSWAFLSRRTYTRFYFTLRDFAEGRSWAHRIRRLALRILDSENHLPGRRYAAIITSGPPHAWHEAGRALSEHTGIPLILDLRDPWSTAEILHDYFATPAWFWLTRREEGRALAQASLVVLNTHALRDVMAEAFPAASSRMIVVMNGYDTEPLPPPTRSGTCFRIGYAGTIYARRNPQPLFAGIARVITELNLTPADIEIHFTGDVHEYARRPLTDIARECGLAGYLRTSGRVDRRTALEFMASCHVLVSLPWDRLSVPAKLFEYMRFHAWLLVFAPPDSELVRLLEGTDADVVRPDDIEGVAAAVRRRFLQFREGIQPLPLSRVERFSRRAQTRRLMDALQNITGDR